MVGKKTFNKILTGIVLFSVCLASSCHTDQCLNQNISIENVCGTYVFNNLGSQDDIVESDTLVLDTDGTYLYSTYLKYHDLTMMDVYPTKGTWTLCDNSVVLNSTFPCDDDSCFIQLLESDKKDENFIVIEVICLSTGKPMSDYIVLSFYEDHYDSLAKTDSYGRVRFQREHTSAIDITDPNGMRIINPPGVGYMYRIYYRDCYLRIHNNERLYFKGNTLSVNKREVVGFNKLGWKKYKTYEYKYIKVADTIGFYR